MANKAASQDENNPNAGDGAGDAFADYGKSYGADISVDGVGDVWNQPIQGNFNQLKKLKAKVPNLKILISIGGWTYSKYFSDAASTDSKRKAFVSSCVNMFLKGDLPVIDGFGGPGSAAGIFDGVDIDWEYPGSPNGHVGNHYSAADKQNFTLLLAEFRAQLDAYGGQTGKKYYLTAATPAGQDKIATIETDKIGQYLDYNNVMTYDMHGGWEATGPTNFQDPLYTAPNDPSNPIPPGQGKYSVDSAVKAWTTGDSAYGIPGGFPANKLTIGYPFYYRGWKGVPATDERQVPDRDRTGRRTRAERQRARASRSTRSSPASSTTRPPRTSTTPPSRPGSTATARSGPVTTPSRSRRRPTTSTATGWPAR